MYEEYTVYGPYSRPDGRLHVVLKHRETKKMLTISYPKYRMECILNRYLREDEHVHHKDEIVSNNADENFEIINASQHKKIHRIGTSKYLPEIWKCVNCGKEWLATSQQVKDRHHNEIKGKGKTGKFCSKKCNGIVNH